MYSIKPIAISYSILTYIPYSQIKTNHYLNIYVKVCIDLRRANR